MPNNRKTLAEISAEISERCTRCGACVSQCAFLQEAGAPADIARTVNSSPPEQWPDAFGCSLCGLCGAVCPEGLEPESLFLAMRQVRMESGGISLKPYRTILDFERRGDSDRLSYVRVPAGGDTVLFPGCGFPASRPKTVRRLFTALQAEIPDIGVALGCCLKPSHDLGRVAFFESRFSRLCDKLARAGVKRVVTVCPNCRKIFQRYGGEIESVTAYQLLADAGVAPRRVESGAVVIHDPCSQRYDSDAQDAIRLLAARASLTVEPVKDERAVTRCCGEGGMVRNVRPDLAAWWTDRRRSVLAGHRVVTSCAGCVRFLKGCGQVDHILDILFDSRPKVKLMGPLADVGRLLLKRWFRKQLG